MLDITSLDGTTSIEDKNAGRVMIEVKVIYMHVTSLVMLNAI